jgi:hypothetical protein
MPKQDYNSGLEENGPHRQGEKGGQGGMNKKAGMDEDDRNRMTQDKNADTGQKNKSTLIGKRHTDMEQEGKH